MLLGCFSLFYGSPFPLLGASFHCYGKFAIFRGFSFPWRIPYSLRGTLPLRGALTPRATLTLEANPTREGYSVPYSRGMLYPRGAPYPFRGTLASDDGFPHYDCETCFHLLYLLSGFYLMKLPQSKFWNSFL